MPTALRLLILEDAPLDAELEVAALEKSGYACQWRHVETRAEFLACLDTPDYDIVLADYSLPAFDGLTALHLFLKRDLDLPFIFVSGTMGEEIAIESLKAGATDYVLKDHLKRLGLVVKRALREREDQRQRKQAEEALRKSQQLLHAIIDNAPVAIQAKDLQGRYLLINSQIETILGLQRQEIIGKTPHDVFPQETADRFLENDQAVLQAKAAVQIEQIVPFPDGLHTFVVLKFPLLDEAGEPYAVAGVSTDITERKRAEEALRQTEVRFRSLIEQTTDAVFCYEYDPPIPTDLPIEEQVRLLYDCVLAECNDVCARSYGATRAEEVVDKKLTDLFGTSSGSLDELFTALVQGGYRIVDGEGVETLEDGTKRYYLNNGYGVVEDGKLLRVWGTFRDITDRVRSEQKRAQVEENLRRERDLTSRITETSPVGITMVNREGQITFANPRAEQVLGLTKDEINQRTYNDPKWHITDYDGNPFPDEQLPFQQVMNTGQPVYDVRHAIEWPDGQRVLLSINAAPRLDEDGQVEGMVATVHDISKQIQAEKALQESENRFRNIIESIPLGMHMYRLEPDGRLIFTGANPAADRILGVDNSQFVGRTIEEAFPAAADSEIPDAYRRAAAEGKTWQNDQSVYEEGEIAGVFEVHAFQTSPGEMTAAFLDITERKRTEEALRESEERFRALVQNSSDIIVVLEPDGLVRYVSPAVEGILGYSADHFLASDPFEDVHPDDVQMAREGLAQAIQNPGTPISTEFRLRHRDGSWVAMEMITNSLLGKPEVRGVVINARDITERVRFEEERARAEKALRESEERFRGLSSVASEGIMIHEDGIILDANQVFANLAGHPDPNDMIGKSGMEMIPFTPESRQRVLSHMRAGPTETYDIELIKPDGTVISAETCGKEITYRGHKARLVLMRDITERKRAEEALRESEERHRALFETTALGVLYRDSEGKIIAANPAAERILGLTLEQMGDDTHADPKWKLVREDGTAFPLDELPAAVALKTGEKVHNVVVGTFPAAREEICWLNVNVTPLFRPGESKPYRIYTVFEDITERKRAEEALHLTQFCVDRASVGIMRTGSDAQIVSVNEQVCHMLGYTAQELRNMHIYDIDPTFPLERWREHRQHLRTQGSDTFETVLQRKDGTTFPVEITNNYVEFQGNGFSIAFIQDITERKQTEEERERLLAEIREQAQQVQQIIDTVPEGVILLDTNSRIILANPLGREDLTILADTLVGGTLTRLGDRPLPTILTSLPQGLWHEITAEERVFQVIARPIEIGPTLKGWVLVIHEVTQQREIERRVQQQERLAAVGQLAAGIAHDFNNIMAVISLYAGMSLRTVDLPAKVGERLETIDRQSRRASDLIQQILDFSRRAVLERRPMELKAFLKEQGKLLERTLPENIQIDLSVGEDEYTVNADPTRVQQAIMNLATNARDAMPEGGRLHIDLAKVQIAERKSAPLPEMEPGEWVRVTVADTGTGIPSDVLPHIYDPFFTTKPVGMGTGLGLSQVYGIVKQHEGQIDVATQEGEGTTFTIYLPAITPQRTKPSHYEAETLVQGQGQTILVVEDDNATRAALADSLELLDYRVVETTNGQEALSILEQHAGRSPADPEQEIALVLSDVVMPGMGGRALFHALKERNLATKVVLLTGHPLDEGELEGLRSQGLGGWLLKPLSIERLSQVVAEALEEE